MNYCRDAQKLLKKKVVCGKDCPIYGVAGEKCPRLIMQNVNDANDEANNIAIEKAIKAMLKARGEK